MDSRLSVAERVYRARRIGVTFGRVYLGIKKSQFIARHLSPPDMAERWSAQHSESANAIYEAAIELRGLILKGCQFIGSRADVLPSEYIEVLSRLQDRVPAKRFPSVRKTVEAELNCALEDIFDAFDESPIASASLAQASASSMLQDGHSPAWTISQPSCRWANGRWRSQSSSSSRSDAFSVFLNVSRSLFSRRPWPAASRLVRRSSSR